MVLFFFFFQAEDGIRDRTVTEVQTCALPIFIITTVNQNRGGCRSIATVERNCRVVSNVCVAGNIHSDNASIANNSALSVIDLSQQRIRMNVPRRDQANNASSPDFSSLVQKLKRQIVGVQVSSDRGKNVPSVNNFINVVVNEKPGIAAGVRSQIVSDA